MRKIYKLLLVTLCLITASKQWALAQHDSPRGGGKPRVVEEEGDVSTILTSHSSNSIFPGSASYTFNVKNTFKKDEIGKLSYLITDQFNKKLSADSIRVDIKSQSVRSFDFNLPKFKSGFYKIAFMINVSDYDDTTRRVFGVRAEEIRSAHQKPDDFDAFWESTRKELAAVPPDFKMTERPDLEKDDRKVYLIEMRSLGDITIKSWLTIPAHRSKYRKFPVLIMLPGYMATTAPLLGRDDDMAFLSVDVRGQGLNSNVISMKREDYIVSRLEDKSKYILRGMIMDCIRCIDFVYSRPELSHDRISVTGGSMGGYLAIATAAIDKRVTLCAPQNPFMSDVYNMDNGAVVWPIQHIKDYVRSRPGLTFEMALDNLQYFDTKNFATNISCPVLMGIGLLDPYVPPGNSFAVYNNITSKKKIFVFKDLGHEVGDKYNQYEMRWMRDTFGLF